ncbi:protein of unknown function [Methylocaldum szegediense]|uniref:Uncharacterized protein n=1 Tax=Methylocaldum szegediense TaxID=73780 RepID=A0ABM9I272_9GAMM|nr:protein of unknown function [Methylocaldum szegediense]
MDPAGANGPVASQLRSLPTRETRLTGSANSFAERGVAQPEIRTHNATPIEIRLNRSKKTGHSLTPRCRKAVRKDKEADVSKRLGMISIMASFLFDVLFMACPKTDRCISLGTEGGAAFFSAVRPESFDLAQNRPFDELRTGKMMGFLRERNTSRLAAFSGS